MGFSERLRTAAWAQCLSESAKESVRCRRANTVCFRKVDTAGMGPELPGADRLQSAICGSSPQPRSCNSKRSRALYKGRCEVFVEDGRADAHEQGAAHTFGQATDDATEHSTDHDSDSDHGEGGESNRGCHGHDVHIQKGGPRSSTLSMNNPSAVWKVPVPASVRMTLRPASRRNLMTPFWADIPLSPESSPPPRIAKRHVAFRLGSSQGCVLPVHFVSSCSPFTLPRSNFRATL